MIRKNKGIGNEFYQRFSPLRLVGNGQTRDQTTTKTRKTPKT